VVEEVSIASLVVAQERIKPAMGGSANFGNVPYVPFADCMRCIARPSAAPDQESGVQRRKPDTAGTVAHPQRYLPLQQRRQQRRVRQALVDIIPRHFVEPDIEWVSPALGVLRACKSLACCLMHPGA
jgi:hypothetical protein